MPLFEVAIIEKPDKKLKERIVLKPTCVLARDEQAAAITTVMDNRSLKMDRERMEILVRPFVDPR